jgi:nucleoid-associated protein YgaU
MTAKILRNDLLVKICVITLMIIYAWSFYDSVGASSYPTDGSYRTVYVGKGDSVWSIAAKHVGDKEDIRSLVAAIKQVNSLSNDVAIHPGQALKIPVKPGSTTNTRTMAAR